MNANGQDPRVRRMTVAELSELDIGRRVRLKRPANSVYAAPIVSGKLVAFAPEAYWRGHMQRQGFAVTVGFPRRRGGFNNDTFGPLPADHEIWVGQKWRDRPEPEWEPAAPFPGYVKRVRVLFLGDPFDGVEEDISTDDFHGSTDIIRNHPRNTSVSLTYTQWGTLTQVKGALWTCKWRLTHSIDSSRSYEDAEVHYRFPPPPSPPAGSQPRRLRELGPGENPFLPPRT